jgi:hypothetical protein
MWNVLIWIFIVLAVLIVLFLVPNSIAEVLSELFEALAEIIEHLL